MSGEIEALGGDNLGFAEAIWEQYLADPAQVDPAWRAVFDPLRAEQRPGALAPSATRRSLFDPAPRAEEVPENGAGDDSLRLQDRVDQLVQAFRSLGHLEAQLDPLGRTRPPCWELDPAEHGLRPEDLDRPCSSAELGMLTVGQVIRRMQNTYCRTIGVQYEHIADPAAKHWLRERMESTENRLRLDQAEQVHLLTRLIDAEAFEQFVRTKYLGAKSFSLEGGESLIPLLDLAIERGAEHGVREVVIGMAHRGRLNVLANIMHKNPREIFREFDDADPEKYWQRGDVKYHLGFQADHTTRSGTRVHLRLAFNPSHLEFVSPVVLGRVRALQDRSGDLDRVRVLPLILHGDAAFAGQGVTQETLNLSHLPGYRTGGALHVVVNNQIGFTTSPEFSRSSGYATDVALMLRVPIFHVNGEDPESVAQVVQLAMDYRHRFRQDVLIDLHCYRRHGHNEGDEPAFTQPLMYRLIRERPTVRQSYLDHLLGPEGLTHPQAEAIIAERSRFLEEELSQARAPDYKPVARPPMTKSWKKFRGGAEGMVAEVHTAVPLERLQRTLHSLTEVPSDLELLPKLRRLLDQRAAIAAGERPLDWAAGEVLAYATLLTDGHPVRISGQDCGRGTFSHRHAVIRDVRDERRYLPLQNLAPDQASFEVWDSPLSEAAVLGFDYGYSLDRPDALVIWEAQFGDFANGAQVIIDQFITSAEDKWELLTGLTMLLPHGFEGQGPEHSSARLERLLQLCAEDNVQVVYPTTPAQIFHLLRRQVVRTLRKPLFVMSPKGLLRLPQATSTLEELTRGGFRRVLPDPLPEPQARPARRILLCSGRVYYDLAARRETAGHHDVAILRLEQLYPFPNEPLRRALQPYPEDAAVVWVQEEPANMGGWTHLRLRAGDQLHDRPLSCVARQPSASPATGSPASHRREQEDLLDRAFA